METEEQFQAGRMQTTGKGGTLLHAFRVISEITKWSASVQTTPDGSKIKMVVTVKDNDHDPDPHWIEHCPVEGLTFEVRVGSKEKSGPAKILSRRPLVFETTLEDV